MKILPKVCAAAGIIGSCIVNILGGWDLALQALVVFMGIDYVTGLMVAGVFQNSKKTETGGLESKAGWKGLCRKISTLLFVIIGYYTDKLAGVSFARYAIIIGFCVNEFISIVENAGLMGLPLPAAVSKALDLLKSKSEEGEKK